MVKRLGSIALAVQAVVLGVLLLAPEVDALRQEGLAGVGGYSVEAVSFPLSRATGADAGPAMLPPTIDQVTPNFVEPLSYVQVSGANFVDVSAVSIGGVPADTFVFFPSSGVVQVPIGAVTGPMSITNPFGTTVSGFNLQVTPLYIGGRDLRASFPRSGPSHGSFSLGWSPATAPLAYHIVKTALAPGVPPISIGPVAASSYVDRDASPGELYCYVVTPVWAGQVLGTSDMECGASGLSLGNALEPRSFSLSLHQTQTVNLSWERPTFVDAIVVTIMPGDGQPPNHMVLPPGTQHYVHVTGGVPTCYLLIGVRVGPPYEYGLTNVLCGVPGASSLVKEAATSPQVLAEGVQRALTDLKLPPLDQVVAAASERVLAPE